MNRDRVDEEWGVTFQLPGVIKCSLVLVCQLESRAKKALNNKVSERVMKVLFMDNANRIIFSELVKTLEKNYLMGKYNYPSDMTITQKLMVNYEPIEISVVSLVMVSH